MEMIGQDFTDQASGVADAHRVGVEVIWDEDHCLRQCVTSTSCPRRFIDGERFAERVPTLAGEQTPSVAGGW